MNVINKVIDNLQRKHDGFIGCQKNRITSAEAIGFENGLAWSIDSIETIRRIAMYPDIERTETNPDIRCPHCRVGIDINTEGNYDNEKYNFPCPACGKEINVLQKIITNYKIVD